MNIPSVFVGATDGELLVTTYAYNKQPFIIRESQTVDPTSRTSSIDLHFKTGGAAPTPSPRRLDKPPEYYAHIVEYSSVGFFAYLVPFVILIVSLLSFLLILVVCFLKCYTVQYVIHRPPVDTLLFVTITSFRLVLCKLAPARDLSHLRNVLPRTIVKPFPAENISTTIS